ncbi:MAG: potassium efflux system protein [Rhodospirillales bacterium]|nr:potassium efflux system protein [Rhodospirillales bacterium]
MAAEAHGSDLIQVVVILAAGVVAVPIFRRLGLGSVLGYLVAGLVIGPSGLRFFDDPGAVLHVAELGVVMFLFIIGLEMQPSRLWNLRGDIFGLGAIQVGTSAALLTGVGWLYGLTLPVAFVAAAGFVMSSTAIGMQILAESGETSTPAGQRIVSTLLFEDVAIVPLLAFIAVIGPTAADERGGDYWTDIAIAGGALLALVAAGKWLLNPLFGLLTFARAREVMTAAALLVVLGSAMLMQMSGLSMALGAFLAGVLLSESTFRHQLEADIEPFRGILLGLFFMSVGMSFDLSLLARSWPLVAAGVVVFMAVNIAGIYLIARLFRLAHGEALLRAAILSQGGEFAFVLYAAASANGLLGGGVGGVLTAIVILSMAATPVLVLLARRLMPRVEPSFDGVEIAEGLSGRVLIIGFGRFGQVACQPLLARGVDISIIEADTDMIRSAAEFGFKVYYGNGDRLEVLRASGAASADAIMVCVDDREKANRIVELAKAEFPLAKLYVRAYDRGHSMSLIAAGVDYQIREIYESATAMGAAMLEGLGVAPEDVAEIVTDVRRRDAERLTLQVAGGIYAGADLVRNNGPIPAPLTVPKQAGRPLSIETQKVIEGATRTPADAPGAGV